MTWYLAENGKLSITGTGATWGLPVIFPNFYIFRSEVTTAEISAGVTGLEDYLFYNMTALEIVVLGPDVERIGYWAFRNCSALTEIRFQGEAPSFASDCFSNVTATAYYPVDDPTWTEDVRQDYGGHITWVPYGGYSITVANYTKGKATTSLVPGLLYSGVVTFTVSCEQAALVTVKNGDEYTVLKCTTVGSEHRYTLTVGDNVEVAVALKGDVNLDGAVKSSEATMIKRAIAGTYNFKDALSALAADVNGDGTVKASDATMLARFIAGTYTIKW